MCICNIYTHIYKIICLKPKTTILVNIWIKKEMIEEYTKKVFINIIS